jgi:four helix bundle protein
MLASPMKCLAMRNCKSLKIASRSASKTQYYLVLAQELKYLGTKSYEKLNSQVIETKRILAKTDAKTGY